MKSHAIDREQWIRFAKDFSRAHDGWIASLEIREAGSPMRVEVDDSPLRGVTVEERDGRDTLVLTFGYEPEEHFAHIIHDPFAMVSAETDDGGGASLVIDSIDRGRCVLALWNPMREEAGAIA
jgi:uncharacterized protein DUF5335